MLRGLPRQHEILFPAQQVYVDTVGEAGRHQQRLEERFPGLRCAGCPCSLMHCLTARMHAC